MTIIFLQMRYGRIIQDLAINNITVVSLAEFLQRFSNNSFLITKMNEKKIACS